jgi:NAD(P)H-dependent FMN reductase
MVRIGIILGSTRPDRNGEQVATWVHERASQRDDADFEVIDLREHPLPHLEEPPLTRDGPSHDHHVRTWADRVSSFEGFIVVTPEYNRSAPGVLKNALDHLYTEWNDKVVGFVSYGVVGGARAIEQLRLICTALQMADVCHQVNVSLTEFENRTVFRPSDHSIAALDATLDQLVRWGTALAPLRSTSTTALAGQAP